MSEQDQNPQPGDPQVTGGDVDTSTDPANPDNPGDSPTTYGTGDPSEDDPTVPAPDAPAHPSSDPVSAPTQVQPDDVEVVQDDEVSDDDRPVWNVETHGKPDPEQAEFYRVVNG